MTSPYLTRRLRSVEEALTERQKEPTPEPERRPGDDRLVAAHRQDAAMRQASGDADS